MSGSADLLASLTVTYPARFRGRHHLHMNGAPTTLCGRAVDGWVFERWCGREPGCGSCRLVVAGAIAKDGAEWTCRLCEAKFSPKPWQMNRGRPICAPCWYKRQARYDTKPEVRSRRKAWLRSEDGHRAQLTIPWPGSGLGYEVGCKLILEVRRAE